MLKIDKEKLVLSVKPYGETKNYADSIFNLKIAPENINGCIEEAEKALGEQIPQLLLSGYRECEKNGNRSRYEGKCFKRRQMLLSLTMGEVADGFKGKYLQKAMDVLWSILEETTWVVPAHRQPENYPECKWLDIFSAATGGIVAAAYFFLKDEIKKEMPEGFCERVLYELRRRVTEPFMSDFSPFHCWKGTEGWYVNNWNPWIVTNALTVTVLTEKNTETRRRVAAFSADYLNRYLNFCFEDGSCIEGAAYFFKSNVCLYDIGELYLELTNGEYDVISDPYMKKLIEYLPNMYAGGGYYFTVGDCGAHKETASSDIIRLLKRMSVKLDCSAVMAIANDVGRGKIEFTCNDFFTTYRSIKDLAVNANTDGNTGTLTEKYMDSVQIMTLRRYNCTAFFKGGNNNEPHGHNDCGEFQIYYKGEPLFIDPGIETYSAGSFSDENWCRRSLYHNAPVLNGMEQVAGQQGSPIICYAATEEKADLADGRLEMELSRAYPEDAKIKSAKRIMRLNDGAFTVSDSYCFEQFGRYEFHLMTTAKPQLSNGEMDFQIGDDIIKCQFNPDYAVDVEEIPVDERIESLWKQNVVYCIKISNFKQNDTFTFSAKL